MKVNDFPNEMYRGISNLDFIDSKFNLVTDNAFQPDCPRNDGYREISINWNDDCGALDVIFNQKKSNNNYQFICVTALDLKRIIDFLSIYILNETLKYERAVLSDNKYHGNILILGSASNSIQRNIRASLAVIAGSNIIYNPNIKR